MLPIVPNRWEHIPVMVSAKVLESLWWKSDLYVPEFEGMPLSRWFNLNDQKTPLEFRTADVRVHAGDADPYIAFTNGRNRTRWLLQTGLAEIPVGLMSEDWELARTLGLAIRMVGPTDTITRPVHIQLC